MEAVQILQGILDNEIMPHRVDKLHGIFRVGKFLAVTDGHDVDDKLPRFKFEEHLYAISVNI